MNGFSAGEEDSRGAPDQVCCLVDDGFRCHRPAGNASYSKRIQKTVTQRRLKLRLDLVVCNTTSLLDFCVRRESKPQNEIYVLCIFRLATFIFAITIKVLSNQLA